MIESEIWRRSSLERRGILAPILASFPFGLLLIQRRARPLTEPEAELLRLNDGFPDWGYLPPDDISSPLELKASDWGRINGRLVAVDYGPPWLNRKLVDRDLPPRSG